MKNERSILRFVLRAFAMGLSAVALTWDVTESLGIAAAVIGAIVGVGAGERFGRSNLKFGVVAGITWTVVLLVWGIGAIAVSYEALPSALGPGTVLGAATFLRYLALAFGTTATARAMAVRFPAAMALELGLVAVSFTALFASHRDGVIARPLWLSDWAWQNDLDPATIFLAVGAVCVVLLAVLLVLDGRTENPHENRQEKRVSSIVLLIALALLALLFIDTVGRPAPQAGDELGLNNKPSDGEHNPPPPDGGPNGREPGNEDGGRGSQGNKDGGSGGPGRADGGGGGQGNTRDGGGGGGSRDGGVDGGSGASSEDGGYGWMLSRDGSAEDGGAGQGEGGAGQPPPSRQDGGGSGGRPPPRQPDQNDDQLPNSGKPAPMAVVILEDDYSPPQEAYYFRQEAWSEYNGHRLIAATNAAADRDRIRAFPTARTQTEEPPPPADRVRVRTRVSLLTEHTFPFGIETPVEMSPMRNPNPQRFVRAYRAVTLAQKIDYQRLLGRKTGNPAWSEEIAAYYLVHPDDDRYQAILDEALAQLPAARKDDAFAKAVAIKLWLDKHLIYSTRHRHAGVEDPTADFLFGDRTGYCVHFAHSAVFLLRRAGIPARIGVGYMVEESARQGGSAILIRGSDAHAWPEIYVRGLGWTILDIAAEQNLDPPGTPQDDDLQRLLGEMARDEPEEPPAEQKEKSGFKIRLKDVGIALGVLLAAALCVLYAIKIVRRIAPSFASSRALPRVAYRAALDLLSDIGVRREHGETREAFAHRLAALVPSLEKLTTIHVAATLAPKEPPPATQEEIRTLLRSVRKEVARGTKTWRYAAGVIHPTGWIETR